MSTARGPQIDLVYFDAGGGHRSAATALRAVMESQHPSWRVRLVNLQETLDGIDVFRRVFRVRAQDIYNGLLERGWTLGSGALVPVMHGILRVWHPLLVRGLRAFWSGPKPDLVVALVPNFNRALFQALAEAAPGAPLVTVLTDLADYPPHFWIEPQAQHVVCGTERAAKQAAAIGQPPERIHRVSGMILRPQFYEPACGDRRTARRELGLDPDRPTGLLLFGGHGSPVMERIARRLQGCRHPLQLIAMAGRNEAVARSLREIRGPVRIHVEGFTTRVPHFMSLADFFIGKPGPGSISEAVAMRLPVIVERNTWTLPQERYNAEWVTEQDVGVVLRSFRAILPAVEGLLEGDRLARLRANTERIENRAVFEVTRVVDELLSSAVPAARAASYSRSGSSGQAWRG